MGMRSSKSWIRAARIDVSPAWVRKADGIGRWRRKEWCWMAPGRGTGYNGGSTGLYTVHVKARKDGHGASSGKHKAAGGLVH
ncbi:hypothetical protein VUR80DRAFT_6684 [Thermomyces stellatus]